MKRIFIFFVWLIIADSAIAQWSLISTENYKFRYWSVYFTNDTTGYIAGSWSDTTTYNAMGVILRTLNGGQSWDTTFIDTIDVFRSVHFPSHDTGYATGGYGLVYKTTNAGQNWIMQTTPANQYTTVLKSIFFSDNYNGYACSSDGENVLVKTNDGGLNWVVDSSISGRNVYFPSKNVGYTVGGAGGYKTIDGGNTWSIFYTGTSNMTFSDIQFLNDTIGFVCGIDQDGYYGAIAKTTDGGITWNTQSIPLLAQINAIYFVSADVGYAVGQANMPNIQTIIKTENGGINWGWQNVNIVGTLPWNLDVSCPSDSICYAVGFNGQIYKTTNGGGTIFSNIDEQYFERNDLLVYPNPFAFSTKLQLSKSLQNATFSIYDFLGKEVKRLENINGTEINIFSDNMKSGMYFFTILDAKGLVGNGKFIIE